MRRNKLNINLNINLLCVLSLIFSFFAILFKIIIKNMGSFDNLTKISLPLYIAPIIFLILAIISIVIIFLSVYLYRKTDVRYFLYKPFLIIFLVTTFLLLTNAPFIKIFEVYVVDNNSILISLMVTLQSLQERFGYLQLCLNIAIIFSIVSLFYLYTSDVEKYLEETVIEKDSEDKKDMFKAKIINLCLKIRVFLERDRTDSFVEPVADIDYTKLQKSNIEKEALKESESNLILEQEDKEEQVEEQVEELLHYDDQADEIVFIKHIEKKEPIVENIVENPDAKEVIELDEDDFISIDEDD